MNYYKFGIVREDFIFMKFCENKTLAKWRNHSVVYWRSKSCFNVAIMSFDANRENKILAEIYSIFFIKNVV